MSATTMTTATTTATGAPRLRFMVASRPETLRALAPSASVEAEYGDAVVEGAIVTMAHHGPRAGAPAPCSYGNTVGARLPEGAVVALSHVDLDTLGGCMALLGVKPEAPSFWRLAEAVDLRGAHRLTAILGDDPGITSGDVARLHAYWAWAQSHRVFAPRDGSAGDVTPAVLEHAETLRVLLGKAPEDAGARLALIEAGEAFRRAEDELNRSSFRSITPEGVILRESARFVNHIYTTPEGVVGRAVVTRSPAEVPPGGAVTMSLADPVEGVSCGELLKLLFGPLAGGHAGIGGSPRGVGLSFWKARKAARELGRALARSR